MDDYELDLLIGMMDKVESLMRPWNAGEIIEDDINQLPVPYNQQVLYILYSPEVAMCKIGISNNPVRRKNTWHINPLTTDLVRVYRVERCKAILIENIVKAIIKKHFNSISRKEWLYCEWEFLDLIVRVASWASMLATSFEFSNRRSLHQWQIDECVSTNGEKIALQCMWLATRD